LPLATFAIVLTVLALSTAPANAHSRIIEQGNDYAVTDSDHRAGAVCDMEKDGNFVAAYWLDEDGRVGYAEDTTDPGCEQLTFTDKATKMYVCEIGFNLPDEGDGCTEIHKV
jgi:hypothetical protein